MCVCVFRCACVRACVRVCVRACVRASVRVCVRACMRASVRACERACMYIYSPFEHFPHLHKTGREVGVSGHVVDVPNRGQQIRRIRVLAGIDIIASQRRKADDADTCLVRTDLR